jgi:CHAT domain-containing protein
LANCRIGTHLVSVGNLIAGSRTATSPTTLLTTRYLPFSALHDGSRYLAEEYQVVGLVEAGTARLIQRASGPVRIAAFATRRGGHGLKPLEFATIEAENLIRLEPGAAGLAEGRLYVDDQFTRNAFEEALEMRDVQVVHAATHFVLVPGREVDSFLLLGNGDRLTAADLKKLAAPPAFVSLDLLALSACETALPTADRDGSEVESFGALAMIKGARSVLATLWAVADRSTAAFMRRFYELRLSGSTKGEAIAETQRAFIKGNIDPDLNSQKWSHPYYWAPFLLMGNFL